MHESREQKTGALIAEVLEHHPATLSLDLAFNVCACRVYSNSPSVITKLERHYQAFETTMASPDFLVTVVECPPVTMDEDFALVIEGDEPMTVDAELVDNLDERLEFDPLSGIVKIEGNGRYILIGPCLDNTDAVVSVIYNLYLEWKWQQASQLATA